MKGKAEWSRTVASDNAGTNCDSIDMGVCGTTYGSSHKDEFGTEALGYVAMDIGYVTGEHKFCPVA